MTGTASTDVPGCGCGCVSVRAPLMCVSKRDRWWWFKVASHVNTSESRPAGILAVPSVLINLATTNLIIGLIRAVYPERNDSSIMTLSILMRWVVTQTNRMIPSMTRYAATTRSRRCPRESEPLACLKFESKQRVIFPLATVAMAY